MRQDAAVSSTAEQPQPSSITLSHDLMSSPTSAEVAALWSEWTPATLIEHLIAETSGQQPPQQQQRIFRRHAVHQLMNLLPHLPEREQAMTPDRTGMRNEQGWQFGSHFAADARTKR